MTASAGPCIRGMGLKPDIEFTPEELELLARHMDAAGIEISPESLSSAIRHMHETLGGPHPEGDKGAGVKSDERPPPSPLHPRLAEALNRLKSL